MSPVASNTLLSETGEVQLTTEFDASHLTLSPTDIHTADDVVLMDPAVMQEKIKELTNRISEVVSSYTSLFHHK